MGAHCQTSVPVQQAVEGSSQYQSRPSSEAGLDRAWRRREWTRGGNREREEGRGGQKKRTVRAAELAAGILSSGHGADGAPGEEFGRVGGVVHLGLGLCQGAGRREGCEDGEVPHRDWAGRVS